MWVLIDEDKINVRNVQEMCYYIEERSKNINDGELLEAVRARRDHSNDHVFVRDNLSSCVSICYVLLMC